MKKEAERGSAGAALSLKEKLGYGAASVGDTMVYNILTVYALFFLTDVAGLAPALAGALICAATVWNAAAVALIGHISDRCAFRAGRRLPYMRFSALPIAVFLVLMFTAVPLAPPVKAVYYTAVMGVLWTAHSTYMVPYEALGAELTADPHERTALRSYARFFMGIGNLFALVFFLYIVHRLELCGLEDASAWQLTTAGMAVIAGFSFLLTARILKEKREPAARDREAGDRAARPEGGAPAAHRRPGSSPEPGPAGMLKSYLQVLRLKPFRHVIFMTFFLAAANVFCSADVVYFMQYGLGLTEGDKPLVFLVVTVTGLFVTPFYAKGARRLGKKTVMAAAYLLSGLLLVALRLIGIGTLGLLCLTTAVYTVGTSAYWQLSYSMGYDVAGVNAAVHGVRNDGVVMSLTKIVFKLASAVATQAFAVVLALTGYDAEAQMQSAKALWGIDISLTLIPAAFFVLAAIAVLRYPLTERQTAAASGANGRTGETATGVTGETANGTSGETTGKVAKDIW